MSAVTIIPAVFPDHLEVARALFNEYADCIGHDLCFQSFGDELRGLPGKYAAPAGGLLLAVDGDTWAGCVALRRLHDSPQKCEMKRLFTRGPYRRTGLGRRLAEEIITLARARGYARMYLDTLDTMTPARTLYESLGFCEVPAYYHNPIPGAVYYAFEL
jgi:GNAT superfamily N-acetyltransferase